MSEAITRVAVPVPEAMGELDILRAVNLYWAEDVEDGMRCVELTEPQFMRVARRIIAARDAQWQAAPQPATDINEAEISRMTERGAKAWAGVDAQALREGGQPAPQAGEVTDKEIERIVFEHTKVNPNQADDVMLMRGITNAVRAILALRPQAVPMTPLEIFSHGPWVFQETGQTFTGAQLDEAAFVKYRAHHGITAQGGEGEQG